MLDIQTLPVCPQQAPVTRVPATSSRLVAANIRLSSCNKHQYGHSKHPSGRNYHTSTRLVATNIRLLAKKISTATASLVAIITQAPVWSQQFPVFRCWENEPWRPLVLVWCSALRWHWRRDRGRLRASAGLCCWVLVSAGRVPGYLLLHPQLATSCSPDHWSPTLYTSSN